MEKYDEVHHPKGETLPTATKVFRVKVVQAFLKSGTPLHTMEYFRNLFEEAGFALTSSSNMRQLIPFILEEEYKAQLFLMELPEMARHWLSLCVL